MSCDPNQSAELTQAILTELLKYDERTHMSKLNEWKEHIRDGSSNRRPQCTPTCHIRNPQNGGRSARSSVQALGL